MHTINNAPTLASYAGLTAPRLQGSPPALRHTASWDTIVSLSELVFNPVNEVPPEQDNNKLQQND